MTQIARSKRQITLYYNSDSSVGKKTLAYLPESKCPVLAIDILKDPPTPAQWLEIARGLGVDVSELLLKDHPVFSNQYSSAELSEQDCLKIMHRHPEVVDQPIAIKGEKVLLINTPTDILQILESPPVIEQG